MPSAKAVRPAPSRAAKGGSRRAARRPIDAEGVLRSIRLLEEAGNFELDGGIIGRIAGSDQELGARGIVFVPGDEVSRHFQADFAAAIVAVALPGAVERGLVVENGL